MTEHIQKISGPFRDTLFFFVAIAKYDQTNMNFGLILAERSLGPFFLLVDLGVFLAIQLHLLQHFAVVPKNEGVHNPVNYGGFFNKKHA